MLDSLKTLSDMPGVSGNEGQVADYICRIVEKKGFKVKKDSMGNVLAWKNNSDRSTLPRLLLSAHMDEVGLIISHIEKTGHLRFSKVGGIEDKALLSKPVLIGEKKIPGVIGAKAIHLQKKEERDKEIPYDKMYIDIGAKDKEEAEKYVKIGDYVSFNVQASPVGKNFFKGKALDNRTGCTVLLELLDIPYNGSICFSFTVQEEVGLRGAAVAAYWYNPDLALVVDTTSAADLPEAKEHQKGTVLGKGPALTFMDQSLIVAPKLLQQLETVASNKAIPFQHRSFTAGSAEGGRIALSKEGVPTAVISVPCRYIHSPVSLLCLDDVKHTALLVQEFVASLERGRV